ncbi:ubiquinol-cytochrome-c reductase complex assembly factor 1-like isoform X1 [Salvia splendens]|uniref:ubiquinol-cytochrome-c reductase complex assembly factor 1-like isoform X1 n=1 Tax=Salvia splendens TaxID=180675 RepID=UPI001C256224|nr:ubiquinol-cytochrome-c reductase complex assembly factor 1-like isoform X1 [Salvia splendens]
MLPRWGRVLSRINSINSFQKNSEFVKRESSPFLFRDYAKVAAAVEPDAKSDISKPEVNLNNLFWSKPRSLALAADSPYRIDEPQYVGIRRFILKLMLFYSKQSQFIRRANAIYTRVQYQVDRPAIYDVFCLEQTFKTTFSLLVLHMWLCLRRLKKEGKDGVELGQYLSEIYNHDLELRVSKAGVNLLLSKWMKELERIFYGNIVAYDAAIGKHDELQNVIWRNVYSDDGKSKPTEGALLSVQAFTRYVRHEASALSLTDKEAVLTGNFKFTSLEDGGREGVMIE